MNIVSCYRASQIAQVSKQAISEKRQVKIDGKYKYKYFGHDKNSGDFGVDLDHIDWKRYMDKRRSSRGFDKSLENMQSNNTKGQVSRSEVKDVVDRKSFVLATAKVISRTYNIYGDELKKLCNDISVEYEGMVN